MNPKTYFDFNSYIARLVASNKLCAQKGFYPCTCTGIDGLEGVLTNFQKKAAFIVSDEVTTGQTVQHGGAWYQRRTFTVFILQRCIYGDEQDRQQKLSTCREVMRQFQTRFLVDEEDMQSGFIYLDVANMPVTEIGAYFASGCTGLYFMVNIDEPIDLSFDANEWIEI